MSEYLFSTATLCFSEGVDGRLMLKLPSPGNSFLCACVCACAGSSHLLSLMMSSRCVRIGCQGPYAYSATPTPHPPLLAASLPLPPSPWLLLTPTLPLLERPPTTLPHRSSSFSGQCRGRAADAGRQRKQAYLGIIS